MSASDDNTARDALARSICARLCDARRSHDELRVVDDVLAGIERGADNYGAMDLARDGRDFDEETAQEFRDALIYIAMRKVAEQHRRREQISSGPSDDRPAAGIPPFAADGVSSDGLTATPAAARGAGELFDVGGEG